MQFKLGEQPEWSGTEKCIYPGDGFIEKLLQESVAHQLKYRGYAVLRLQEDVIKTYSAFHTAFEEFSHQPLEVKRQFATTFTDDK
jgi:hypothetical protein